MGNHLIPALLVIAIAAMFLMPMIMRSHSNKEPDDEGVDIEGEAKDPKLVGDVTITRQVEYPGTREEESCQKAIVLYETRYPGGGPRVKKWILSRHEMGYLTMGGHYVVYEYFGEDGTLQNDEHITPDANLVGGAYIKTRLRVLDGADWPRLETYFRADGSLASKSVRDEGKYYSYRKDGETLHSIAYNPSPNGQKMIWYRVDGKTIWMEKDDADNKRVYFDRSGNPVDLYFTTERLVGGYSMGPQSESFLTSYDHYTDVDGKATYRQSWFVRWDKTADGTVDSLSSVLVYDEAGALPKAEYSLELRSADKQRFITEAKHFNDDGTVLVRRYRSVNCRESEQLFGADGQLIETTNFGRGDSFEEPVDEIIFQGFMRNLWGLTDDFSHDI